MDSEATTPLPSSPVSSNPSLASLPTLASLAPIPAATIPGSDISPEDVIVADVDAPTGDVVSSASPVDNVINEIEPPRVVDPLRVHFRRRVHHIIDMGNSEQIEHDQQKEEGDEEKDRSSRPFRRAASRLVRRHTGKPSWRDSDTEVDTDVSSSAVSLASASPSRNEGRDDGHPEHEPNRPRRQRTRRQSSVSSAGSEMSDEDLGMSRGGVLSALLGLYREEASTKQGLKRVVKGDLKKGRRRHWSEGTLFDEGSRNTSASSLASERFRRESRDSEATMGEVSDTGGFYRSQERVHRNRRRQQLPHRSQNLDDPYIPSPKYSNPLTPGANVTIAQQARAFVVRSVGGLLGQPAVVDEDAKPYRTMAALVVATSGLSGFASPTLAHLAPATGRDAETSEGVRKLSWYEGVIESEAREQDEVRREDSEVLQAAEGEVVDMDKRMEQGRRGRQRRRGKRRQKEMAITKHVSSILQRKKFIEMLAKAVVNYGAPAHSVEFWLEATAHILDIHASFIYFPGVLIVAFRDTDVHSTDILFIKPRGALELYRLSLVHSVYRKVVHDEISASQGCRVLRRIQKKTSPYSRITLILFAGIASGCSARVAFSGSFIDILMGGALGMILAVVQFTAAEKHRLVSNIFEIGIAGILSFIARGLGTTEFFCFESLASAAIVLILPGWHICLGSLELGSKMVAAGAIRIVWAIIYTLFLSFGLSLGSQIWDAVGPAQYTGLSSTGTSDVTIQGSFTSNNSLFDTEFNNGTFTFTNGSMTTTTTVTCYRNPDWDYWWYTEPSDWWLFLLVPMFAFALAVWFRADWRSKDILVMVVVASAGYVVNFYVEGVIDQTNVSTAVASFTIGILGNLYSRFFGGSAFPSMVVGILLEVPNAIAAAGGLSASSSSSSDSQTSTQLDTAVVVSIRMVQSGIGLAIGLFAAALVVYPLGKKNRYIFSY